MLLASHGALQLLQTIMPLTMIVNYLEPCTSEHCSIGKAKSPFQQVDCNAALHAPEPGPRDQLVELEACNMLRHIRDE